MFSGPAANITAATAVVWPGLGSVGLLFGAKLFKLQGHNSTFCQEYKLLAVVYFDGRNFSKSFCIKKQVKLRI